MSDDKKNLKRLIVLAEIALIFALFCAYGYGPPPNVNEAHYLAKAKHYWDPAWCEGDHFLDSADAHIVFYWTFGWTTHFMSFEAAAWTGRILTWLLLAWSLRRLTGAITTTPGAGVLCAILFLFLLDQFHAAGEWVIGGVEAKGFAYVFVFLGLEAIVRNRWPLAWVLLGAASALHVLVGGWVVLAALFAWLTVNRHVIRGPRPQDAQLPTFQSMVPWLVTGGLLSLFGLLPAILLNYGVDPEVVARANVIYVFQRLPHHLVPSSFHLPFLIRFVVLSVLWLLLSFFTRDNAALRLINRVTAGTLIIALIGVAVDLCLTRWAPNLAASLLRYYWFRLADVMVPLGVGLSAVFLMAKWWQRKPQLVPLIVGGCFCLGGWLVYNSIDHYCKDPRPAGVAQSRPWIVGENQMQQRRATLMIYDQWREACQWIQESTQPETRFLSLPNAQTFKWHAQRPEVFNWKDVPQDARGLLQWAKRRENLYFQPVCVRDQQLGGIVFAWNLEEMAQQARDYDCQYLIIDTSRIRHTIRRDRSGLKRAFPEDPYKEASIVIYKVLKRE